MIKDKKKLAIILGIAAAVLAIVIGAIVLIVSLVSKNSDDNNYAPMQQETESESQTQSVSVGNDNEQGTEEEKPTEAKPVEKSSYEKLRADYKAGKINANAYFAQLLCIAYDSKNIDEDYKSDNKVPMSAGELGIEDFYNTHKSELSDSVKKTFLKEYFQMDVAIGVKSDSATETQPATGSSASNNASFMSYTATTVANQEEVKNHTLDKVYLSKNGNFLIWYTETGADAITAQNAKDIGDKLEDAVVLYEQTFGAKYKYNPKVDNSILSSDYSAAKKAMQNCGVDTSNLEKAMSVYVFDTGSDNVVATHYYWLEFGLDWHAFWGSFDNDGIINYPYIRINKRSMADSVDSLYQVAVHELFHQYQEAYGEEKTGTWLPTGDVILETGANYASALANKATSKDLFLNTWAGRYASQTSTSLKEIANEDGATGYAIFPYMYSYAANVNNGNSIILDAHLHADSLAYMHQNASPESLVNTINHLAYSTLTQDYTNVAFLANKPVTLKKELANNSTYNETIALGAIDYYKLNPYMNIKASTTETTFVHFNIFGKKGNNWSKLIGNTQSLDISTYQYKDYDEIYLAVTNGSLIGSHPYTIEMGDQVYSTNGATFNTSINNYSMKATMNITMSGITTTSVMTGKVDQLHQKEYIKTQVMAFGIAVSEVETYADFAAGVTYASVPTMTGSQWQKEKSASQLVDMKGILNNLTSMKNVEKISDTQYRIKMSASEVQGLMESGSNDVNTSGITGTIDVDVYVSNGYITKMEYDFSKLVSGIQKYTTTITFSDYNTAGDVNIPQVVIDAAK
ncbi:MAG: hypothetical protein IJB96_06140 [Lachnospira sp.]|nr:hypothetical protein [Lachnospira sp.]